MNENPPPAGSQPEPESQPLNEDSPTRGSTPAEPEVHPPEPSIQGTAQNLPAAPRQGWVSKVLGGGRARRDQQLQTLQSGYVEMLDMMRSISNHLDRQAYNQDQLMKTLDHFPEAVDGLRNVGKATQQQTEVLGMVRTQLESNAEHEREIVKSMDGFNKTLNLMDETSRSTTATIGELVENSRDSEDELRSMLERSERRLTMLTGILGVIGLIAIGGAIYFGLSQRNKAPAADTATEPDPLPALSGEPVGPETNALEVLPDPIPVNPDVDVLSPAVEPDLDPLDPMAENPNDETEWVGESDLEGAEPSAETTIQDPDDRSLLGDGADEDALDAEVTELDADGMETEVDPFLAEDSGEMATDEAAEVIAEIPNADTASDAEAQDTDPDGELSEDATEEIADEAQDTMEPVLSDASVEETEEEASPPLMEPAAEGESEPGVEGEEPAGVKNVVRQFFSFLGDEDITNDVAEAEAAADEDPQDAPIE